MITYKTPIDEYNFLFENNLIVSDNLGYLYSINIETSEINWAKNYGIPFKSNIKIDNQNIIILNQDNKYLQIYCYLSYLLKIYFLFFEFLKKFHLSLTSI